MVAIAAGTVHSVALTNDGALFCWVSSDADLRCRQVLLGSIFCLYLAHKPPRFLCKLHSLIYFYAVIFAVWENCGQYFCW